MVGFWKKLFGGADDAAPAPKRRRTAREEKDGIASESVFVSDDPARGFSLAEAAALHEEAMKRISDEAAPVSQKVNAAARLMMGGAFKQCVAAYEEIARLHPDRRGECYGQIGAAYFFLGEYETAIAYYEKALDFGADASMMADNIEEAREAIAKKREEAAGAGEETGKRELKSL